MLTTQLVKDHLFMSLSFSIESAPWGITLSQIENKINYHVSWLLCELQKMSSRVLIFVNFAALSLVTCLVQVTLAKSSKIIGRRLLLVV